MTDGNISKWSRTCLVIASLPSPILFAYILARRVGTIFTYALPAYLYRMSDEWSANRKIWIQPCTTNKKLGVHAKRATKSLKNRLQNRLATPRLKIFLAPRCQWIAVRKSENSCDNIGKSFFEIERVIVIRNSGRKYRLPQMCTNVRHENCKIPSKRYIEQMLRRYEALNVEIRKY